ncbi:MAG TPA: BolA family protein [Chiayiivirga sp.]|nr:BolA family protein [Chiayiivirga sp.]
MQARIHQALLALAPAHLEVEDESHRHARGLQTHYKAVIVSTRFAGLPLLRRHQLVHASLGEVMAQFHALALHTYTPEEWNRREAAPKSPACLGGSRHDRK